MKLLNTPDLGSGAERLVGWSPTIPTNKCIDCDKSCSLKSTRCKSCESIRKNNSVRKRVSKEELILDLQELKTYVGIAKKYSVSDVSIKKWCKFHNLT